MPSQLLPSQILYQSNCKENIQTWRTVNDGVMGGISSSRMTTDQDNVTIFSGEVSLANNGGFCATKLDIQYQDLPRTATILFRIKGDGKQYQFRVKEFRIDKHAFTYAFTTRKDWEVIKIPISELTPFYRGRQLDLPNYTGGRLEEITFLIGNKVAEHFELCIDKIWIEF